MSYLTRAEYWLLSTILLYFLMNGAQIFETLVFVPKWTASPPGTFGFLADSNGTSLKAFWIAFHSLHEIVFILAIIFSWKIPGARLWLIILFIVHFAVRAWTLAYFAPNIIEFQKIASASAELPGDLAARVSMWRKLNYVRVAIFIAVSLAMVPVYQNILHLKNR